MSNNRMLLSPIHRRQAAHKTPPPFTSSSLESTTEGPTTDRGERAAVIHHDLQTLFSPLSSPHPLFPYSLHKGTLPNPVVVIRNTIMNVANEGHGFCSPRHETFASVVVDIVFKIISTSSSRRGSIVNISITTMTSTFLRTDSYSSLL